MFGEGLELSVAINHVIDKGVSIDFRSHRHTVLRPEEEGGILPIIQVFTRLRTLIDKRSPITIEGEIALGDALHLCVEGTLHHFILSQALEGMTDGLTETIDLTGTIDPAYATATKLRLELFTEITRQDITLNERVAEIGDSHRAIQLLDT